MLIDHPFIEDHVQSDLCLHCGLGPDHYIHDTDPKLIRGIISALLFSLLALLVFWFFFVVVASYIA